MQNRRSIPAGLSSTVACLDYTHLVFFFFLRFSGERGQAQDERGVRVTQEGRGAKNMKRHKATK